MSLHSPTTALWPLTGGIHPAECKTLSNQGPIVQAPLPKELIVPLCQHLGVPAEPCVAVGERVLKGQMIARASGTISAAIHAPSSGTVRFIGEQPYPHSSNLPAPAIVIATDGLDQWGSLTSHPDYRQLSSEELIELIQQAGIAGLGGAGFPTAAKLLARSFDKIHTLIINGTECEPYITADDLLMRERAQQLVLGIDILVHLIQPQQVLIGIEDNKLEAAAALKAALGERSYLVKVFPTKYPSGGEKQLIQILTGKEVPSGALPADIGMLCHNVGTCVAIYDAVLLGKPLISRITTLTGQALSRPGNVEVLIGTPVGELLEFAGLKSERLSRLIFGGPMMGFSLINLKAPIIKTANCLLAATAEELPPPPPALPCIRCGECAIACPVSLLPQQLHFFAQGQQHDQLKAHHLFDCIECGACAYVCPSSIPLVQYYRAAKAEIRELDAKQQKSEHAKQRFETRQERLRLAELQKEAERAARAERAAKAKATQAAEPQAQENAAPADPLKTLKIQASMAQVALKKAQKQLDLHGTDELKAQVEQLTQAAQQAQNALDQAQAQAPQTAAIEAEDAAQALKKAKIEVAMLKVQLRKLEQLSDPDKQQQAQLEQTRQQLQAAEQQLKQAQG